MNSDFALESYEYCQMLPANEDSPRQGHDKEIEDAHLRGHHDASNTAYSSEQEQSLLQEEEQSSKNNQYEIPSASWTFERSKDHEYKSLRKSRVERNDYTLAKTFSRNKSSNNSGTGAGGDDVVSRKEEGKRRSWSRMTMCIMCCIVVYITVTFAITATLMVYTIWSVQEVDSLESRLYDDLCRVWGCMERNNIACGVSL